MNKLTAKQNAFIHGIAKGLNQSDAYRAAYNAENMSKEAIYVEACNLAAAPKLALSLFKLQQKARERTLVTIESITVELEEARQVGKTEAQSAAMTSASMGKAKIHGLLIDQVDHTNSDGSLSAFLLNVAERGERLALTKGHKHEIEGKTAN